MFAVICRLVPPFACIMSVPVDCVFCHGAFTAPSTLLGQSVPCPECGVTLFVSGDASEDSTTREAAGEWTTDRTSASEAVTTDSQPVQTATAYDVSTVPPLMGHGLSTHMSSSAYTMRPKRSLFRVLRTVLVGLFIVGTIVVRLAGGLIRQAMQTNTALESESVAHSQLDAFGLGALQKVGFQTAKPAAANETGAGDFRSFLGARTSLASGGDTRPPLPSVTYTHTPSVAGGPVINPELTPAQRRKLLLRQRTADRKQLVQSGHARHAQAVTQRTEDRQKQRSEFEKARRWKK